MSTYRVTVQTLRTIRQTVHDHITTTYLIEARTKSEACRCAIDVHSEQFRQERIFDIRSAQHA